MECMLFNYNTDYEVVSSWWKKRNCPIIPKDFLGNYGFIINENNKKLCAIWLYPIMTTKWCMVRFPISNPDITKEEHEKSLDLLFSSVHNISKDMGYKHIFCSTNHDGFIKRLNKYGYNQEATDCVHFWGVL